MRVRTRRFNEVERVTPRESSGSPVPAPATTCSSCQHYWQWFWPYASSPCGSSRDGLPDDATRPDALTPGSACASSASVSNNTCEDDVESTDRACRTVSAARPDRSNLPSHGGNSAARRCDETRMSPDRQRGRMRKVCRRCVCHTRRLFRTSQAFGIKLRGAAGRIARRAAGRLELRAHPEAGDRLSRKRRRRGRR